MHSNKGIEVKKILIAFDVDGTLISNDWLGGKPVPNERVRRLLIDLAHSKNVKIMVWSGGGELYVRQVCAAIGIDKYVDLYADKRVTSCAAVSCPEPDENHWHFAYDGDVPDIAFDDIQSFSLGVANIIVREK